MTKVLMKYKIYQGVLKDKDLPILYECIPLVEDIIFDMEQLNFHVDIMLREPWRNFLADSTIFII